MTTSTIQDDDEQDLVECITRTLVLFDGVNMVAMAYTGASKGLLTGELGIDKEETASVVTTTLTNHLYYKE